MAQMELEIEKAEKSIERLNEVLERQMQMLNQLRRMQTEIKTRTKVMQESKQSLLGEIEKKQQTVASLQRMVDAEQRRLERLKVALRQGPGWADRLS